MTNLGNTSDEKSVSEAFRFQIPYLISTCMSGAAYLCLPCAQFPYSAFLHGTVQLIINNDSTLFTIFSPQIFILHCEILIYFTLYCTFRDNSFSFVLIFVRCEMIFTNTATCFNMLLFSCHQHQSSY
jgi:hypothetical protein